MKTSYKATSLPNVMMQFYMIMI